MRHRVAVLAIGLLACGDEVGTMTADAGPADLPPMCAPAAGSVADGDRCDCSTDCTEGALCVPERDEFGWPGGACARMCEVDDECSGTDVCEFGVCSETCAHDGQCPESRFCLEGVCVPHCSRDDECRNGRCDRYTGSCNPPRDESLAGLNEPCVRDEDCRSETCNPEIGICTSSCELGEEGGCPENGVCFSNNDQARDGDRGLCLLGCEDTPCPEGFLCSRTELPGDRRLCIPPGFSACDSEPRTVRDGWPCGCSFECMPGARCASESFEGEPGGRCFRECTRDEECMGGAICDEFGFCAIPCEDDTDCPEANVCDGDGTCFGICQSDDECTTTGHCNLYSGECTDGSEEDRGGVNAPCTENEDCNGTYCSSDGECLVGCRPSRQACPDGAVCAGTGNGVDFALCYLPCDEDMSCPDGQRCLESTEPPGLFFCI